MQMKASSFEMLAAAGSRARRSGMEPIVFCLQLRYVNIRTIAIGEGKRSSFWAHGLKKILLPAGLIEKG